MDQPGRNAPCPCGSGTKYKKCCYLRTSAQPPPALARPPLPAQLTWTLEDDGLDALSNSVVDLIDARRFDEALAACQRLLLDYPDVVDGLERSAMVHSARGDHATAASFYREAYSFVTHPSRRADYEDADYYRQEAAREERLALPR